MPVPAERPGSQGRPARSALALALAAAGLALPGAAFSQETASGLRIEPRVGAAVTVSDNLSPGLGYADAGALLSLSPGLRAIARTAALSADVDYSASLLRALRTERQPESVQHRLSARALWAPPGSEWQLAANAGISQQAVSAFGVLRPQESTPGLDSLGANQAEFYTLSVSPSWSTRLGSWARLQLQHTSSLSEVKGSSQGDSRGAQTALTLGTAAETPLRWGLRLAETQTRPRDSRSARTRLAEASLDWLPDIDWRFGVSAGREQSDLLSAQQQSGASYGASLQWRPTPRTQVSANARHQVAGNTRALNLSHRFSRLIVNASSSNSINEPGLVGQGQARSNYELLFEQLAAAQPDPVLRDQLVRATLQQLGLSPDARAGSGFISSLPTRTRADLVSVSYLPGPRSSLTATASRSDSRRLSGSDAAADDLAQSSRVRSEGASLSAGYKLRPNDALSLGLQWQRNNGQFNEQQVTLRSASLSWSSQLALRTSLQAQLRHTVFDSRTQPYTENALTVSVQQRF